MKKGLYTVHNRLFHYEDGKKVKGKTPALYGDCSGLYGNCSALYGDCSGLSGDIDLCDISAAERKKGIAIQDLVNKQKRTTK